jgi:hypothetical protein
VKDRWTCRWKAMAPALVPLMMMAGGGCDDRLVDGTFLGDSTIRLRGELASHVVDPRAPLVGAVWLGYAGLSNPTEGIETTALPITALGFAARFTCEILDPPPSSGRYQLADGRIVPAEIRIARLIVIDDLDGDGHFGIDASGALVAPDRLLARAVDQVLLFVQHAPHDPGQLDATGAILTNWEAAFPGYHLVSTDPAVAPPNLSGHVVDNSMTVGFVPPPPGEQP